MRLVHRPLLLGARHRCKRRFVILFHDIRIVECTRIGMTLGV